MELLSTRLAAARAEAGLTQTELARAAGLKNQSIVGSLESGYRKSSSYTPALAAALGVNALWLAEGRGPRFPSDPPEPRPIIEAADTPISGYVRLEHLSPTPQMGAGATLDEPMHIVRHLDVLEAWIREEIGSTNPARIKVLTAVGRSMAPTIQDRDLVFVDVSHRHFDAPGIFVIDIAGRLLLKKVMMQADGTVIIRSDNTAEFPDEERYPLTHASETITVCGKVLAWWTLKKG
ncbi:MAG: S24 family peptidase [Thauera sp.]|jgi:phage repressor protein C with HTH and peptisase S24 domain|nr:S24 family peptidase [Thauera sp.]